MPLPASLFLQRGRSDSMMNMLDSEDATSPVSATPLHAPMPPSDLGLLQAPDTHIEVDKNGAPLSTPPITMTAFDSQYGPYGLLASAMSCSDEEPQTRLHHNASTFSTANANTNNASSRYPFNPRANLLRRTSSSSTLDSSEDEEEVAWSQHDIERLTAVYEACVEEASFETPFSGPPPSQLLHAIAKACRRAYRDTWPHSITQTRSKALQIAKEKERLELGGNWDCWAGFNIRRPSVEATPKPPGAMNGEEAEATPRRKLRRNDSMDFLPESWDLDAVARLSDKLNKSGEDDPMMYHYHPHRVRTDTCSSGSDHAPVYRSSGPSHGRLLRSMTFTALNNLDEESSFASSAITEIPHSRDERQQQQQFEGDIEDYSQHPLAQSDPSLQTTLAQGRRPSLRPGFEYLQAPSVNKAMPGHTLISNTLRHATSSYSLYSEQSQSTSTTSSSFYSTPSLNSSMDTMALSNEDTSSSSSWYGTSFASTTSHLSTTAENRKRSFSRSLREGANGDENGELGGWLGGMLRDKTVTPGTPSASHTAGNGHDYFTSSSINALQAGPVTSSTSMQSKRPNNINTNTTSSPHKPPLMKSYTFDSISSKSPTKKYMRLDCEISALDTIPSPRHQHQFSLLGGPSGKDDAEGGQMMLESPFELGFNGGEGARIR